MHILVMILGIAAGLGFWWFRLRAASDAAGEVIDIAGRVRGSMRRKKIRRQNELSPLTAIHDPVVAAATLAAALASDNVALSPEREKAIHDWLGELASATVVDEAMVYGKWASMQIDDAQTVIDKLAPLLASKLTEDERRDLLVKMNEILAEPGPELVGRDQRARRLTQKIGREVR